MFDLMIFDLFVIGGGSGGVRAARIASQKGLKVALAEERDLGGTCVNRGCIPKKLYSYASLFMHEIDVMKDFGWRVNSQNFFWKKLVASKQKELVRLRKIYNNILNDSNVKVFNNKASILEKNKIFLNNKKIINPRNILIAVGGRPKKLNFQGSEFCIDSDQAFDLRKLPKKILIIGAGYIALEFASIFNGLGVDTTVCLRGRKILKDFDEEISFFLCELLQQKGIKFIFEEIPKKITKRNLTLVVFFKTKTEEYNTVMSAVGRSPSIENIGIENTKIKTSNDGSIVVDDYFETDQKGIFAIGDVINKIQLTPVAIAEAMNLVNNLNKKRRKRISYENIPTAVFSNPNVATVGFTEKQAKLKFKKIKIFRSKFKPLKLSLGKHKEKVFIKMIVETSSEKVIGLHYVGPNAAEIIQGFAVAIVNGLKKSDFDRTIGIHPSSAEEIVTMK